MSMNFGREQALLRQRLTKKGSEELIAELTAQHGESIKFLGADQREITAAANDLTQLYPEMGRAQMTAFVRTLWATKTYELRCVGVEILAMRAALLEPQDHPFVESLLQDASIESLSARIADGVLGPLTCKNKKLWKNLGQLAKSADQQLRRAAVRAARIPVVTDAKVFSRFEELVTPLLNESDALLQEVIDDVLQAANEVNTEAVAAFAQEHDRQLRSK